MPTKIKRYGWKPDIPDPRDLKLRVSLKITRELPPSVDLRPQMPPVVDQGDLGSCTANAVCGMIQYVAIKENDAQLFPPSRLFEYYNTRILEGTVKEDSGASIRNSIKAMVKYGFCPEEAWPYDIAQFKKKPPALAYKDAVKHLVRQYHSVAQTAGQIRGVLATGFPVDFGFSVYESFESAAVMNTGVVPMPAKREQLLGGHAVLVVGYDDVTQRYTCRNSWGATWGDKGYFYMPYAYVLNRRLASDFWTINSAP